MRTKSKRTAFGLATGSRGVTDSAYYEAIAEQHKADVMGSTPSSSNSRRRSCLTCPWPTPSGSSVRPNLASRSHPLRGDCVASHPRRSPPEHDAASGNEVQAAHRRYVDRSVNTPQVSGPVALARQGRLAGVALAFFLTTPANEDVINSDWPRSQGRASHRVRPRHL